MCGGGGRKRAYRDDLAVPVPVPITVRDLDILLLHVLLHPEPLRAKFIPVLALRFLTLAVGEEVGVDRRILAEPGLLGGSICK